MTTAQTHQPVAYQIEDANGEFMCLSRTKSTIRGIASKPLYAESALEKERAARIEAQVENEALKAERARYGLAHRKAVQEAVREALHEAKKACENLPAPEACSGVERSLWDVATMACAEAVGNVGTP